MTDPRPPVFDDPKHLPGLTLDQPYAGAVLLAAMGLPGKDIETRKTKITRVPCEIVICVGQKRRGEDLARLFGLLVRSGKVPEPTFDAVMSLSGVAVVLATVTACRPLTAEDYTRSLWWEAEENARKPRQAWELASLRLLKPFRWSGCQGWSRVPRKIVEASMANSGRSGSGCAG